MTSRLSELAEARHALHTGHASHRPLSENYELVGLAGEAKFAEVTGLPVDEERRPAGDKGIDFSFCARFTIDVKTARKPGYLIVEEGHVHADIYVLARFIEETVDAELLGWEWGKLLARTPLRDFGYGVQSHHVRATDLRPMTALVALTKRRVG